MFVEAGLEAATFAWDHRRSLGKVSRELFQAIREGRTRVLVFGASGAGKSTVGKLLGEKLTDEDLLRGYVSSRAVESYDLGKTVAGSVLVAPGQRLRRHAADELRSMLTTGKVAGVMNVVAYGHHAFDPNTAFQEHRAFQPGMTKARFLTAYLKDSREEELRELEILVPAIVDCPRKLWFMTVVTKQDLWWDKRAEVRQYL